MKNLYIVLIGLQKPYGKVLRRLFLCVLNRRNVAKYYVEMIKDVYEGTVVNLRTTYGKTGELT